MDYSSSCRLCLSKEDRLLPIFGSSRHGPETLNDRILSCLSIKVSEFDDLPKQVCHRCECQVHIWHYFRAACEISQNKLQAWQSGLSHSRSSLLPENETSVNIGEVLHIKQEPEDVDLSLHIEHDINHSLDENIHPIYNGPVEEVDLSNQHYSGDETSNPFTFVISGTSSVAPDACPTNYAHEVVNEDTTCNTLEVHLDNSNDGVSTDIGNKDSNDILDPASSFTNHSQVNEHLELAGGSSNIKEEPVDIGHYSQCQSHDYGQTATSSSSAALNHPSEKKYAESCPPGLDGDDSTTEDTKPVYYIPFDLPQINNDLFDESRKYCKICKKSYTNLWRHLKENHIEKNPFRCEACHKIFPGRREFVTHRIRTISKYCRAGKEPYVELSSIITHENVLNGKVGKFECRQCQEKFSYLNTVIAHVRAHAGEKPYFCYKCNEKEFRIKKTAMKHVSTCRGKNEGSMIVPKGKLKLSTGSLKISKVLKVRTIKPVASLDDQVKSHKCPKCGKTFKNGTGFSNHLRIACVKKCISCSKLVSTKVFHKHFRQCFRNSVTMAFEKKSISSTSLLGCDSATEPRVIKEERIEQDLGEIKNMKERPNRKVTPIVDESFKDLWAKQKGTDGNLTLKCRLCFRVLKNRKSMHAHVIKHSSRAYQCKICNKFLNSLYTLASHMTKFHGNFHRTANSDQTANKIEPSSQEVLFKSKKSGKFSGVRLKCDVCSKMFSSASSLKFHKMTHKKVKCKRCEITFPASMERSHICTPKVRMESSNNDIQQVAGEEPPQTAPTGKRAIQYTCHLCKKKFHTKKILYQHKKMHIKMKIYKCKICENSYSNSQALEEHRVSTHANESMVLHHSIKVLSETGNPEVEVGNESKPKEEHVNVVAKPWKCTRCCKRYSHLSTLQKHMKLHRALKLKKTAKSSKSFLLNSPVKISCNLCDKVFDSNASFIRHKGWHSRDGNFAESVIIPQEIEPTSSEDIISSSSIAGSSSRQVASPNMFGCDICSKRFLSLKNLRIHMFCHRKVKSESTKGEEQNISSSAPSQGSLFVHKCEICCSTFSDPHLFSSHMASHASSPSDTSTELVDTSVDGSKMEQLQCLLCNKEYKCKKSLKYHMNGHSGEKPYKCKSCSNQYSNPKALTRHEKERHTPILRPFSCHKCKTSFILKDELLAHHDKCSVDVTT